LISVNKNLKALNGISALVVVLSICVCSCEAYEDPGGRAGFPSSAKSTLNPAKEVYVVSQMGWASTDVMNLKKLLDNYRNDAVKKQMFDSGEVFPLKTGLRVEILAERQGIVKVKPVDNPTILWTFKAILKKE